MKIMSTFVIMLGVVFILNASGMVPMDPHSNFQINKPQTQAVDTRLDMKVAYPASVRDISFYDCLEALTIEQRENAKIEIEFMLPVSPEIELFAQEITHTWNSGYFDEALQMCAELEKMDGVNNL